MRTLLTALVVLVATASLAAQTEPTSPAVAQLRHAAGTWDVVTEEILPDGSIGRTLRGTYRFEWASPDRVLVGRADQPGLGQSSGLLFYYTEHTDTIAQVAVGPDGHLWMMSGPGDSEVRTTQPAELPDGSTMQLRFTRYNVEPDRFESEMEISFDEGATWARRNHQVLTRQDAEAAVFAAERNCPPAPGAEGLLREGVEPTETSPTETSGVSGGDSE